MWGRKGERKIITSFNNEGGNEKERERERDKIKRRMNLNNVSKWWDFFCSKILGYKTQTM